MLCMWLAFVRGDFIARPGAAHQDVGFPYAPGRRKCNGRMAVTRPDARKYNSRMAVTRPDARKYNSRMAVTRPDARPLAAQKSVPCRKHNNNTKIIPIPR